GCAGGVSAARWGACGAAEDPPRPINPHAFAAGFPIGGQGKRKCGGSHEPDGQSSDQHSPPAAYGNTRGAYRAASGVAPEESRVGGDEARAAVCDAEPETEQSAQPRCVGRIGFSL